METQIKFWLVLSFLYVNKVLAQCPSGWMRHEERCYHFSHDTEPWMSAKDTCILYGGYLADITTYSEDMFLQNMVQRLTGDHWVGGNDLMNEGEWKWVNSNDDLGYTNWLAGEPNNKAHNENCMDLRVRPGWNDERCDISQFYICEKSDGSSTIFG